MSDGMAHTERRKGMSEMAATSGQNNKILWWIMGILASIFLALITGWAASVKSDTSAMSGDMRAIRESVAERTERIVRLETKGEDTERRLIGIEKKVDDILIEVRRVK